MKTDDARRFEAFGGRSSANHSFPQSPAVQGEGFAVAQSTTEGVNEDSTLHYGFSRGVNPRRVMCTRRFHCAPIGWRSWRFHWRAGRGCRIRTPGLPPTCLMSLDSVMYVAVPLYSSLGSRCRNAITIDRTGKIFN